MTIRGDLLIKKMQITRELNDVLTEIVVSAFNEEKYEKLKIRTTELKQELQEIIDQYEALDLVMGVEEASELWGLSAGYIKNICAEGKVKSKKIGNTWVIDKTQPNPSAN